MPDKRPLDKMSIYIPADEDWAEACRATYRSWEETGQKRQLSRCGSSYSVSETGREEGLRQAWPAQAVVIDVLFATRAIFCCGNPRTASRWLPS